MPYLGFFDKIAKSDLFFILDDAQFSKEDFHNRNRIKTREGSKWLTIPVEKKKIPLTETRIKNEILISGMEWEKYHPMLIKQSYANTTFFKEYFSNLEKIYDKVAKDTPMLSENNMLFIEYLCDVFRIKVPKIRSSTLGIETQRSQRIVDICKVLHADTYLSGDGAKNYLDEKLFEDNDIKLFYQNYNHPLYSQANGDFIPYMAAIDYLFNCGANLP
ncbi:MAG: WbqC family protein [Candidatus Woesearchaeota archaeon]|nr:WbqC family protein [Candidatus Woesearchaeota archaeon]